ncbi:MAG: serine/threonine protein kinase [Planctomycetes bacterium ADurb.Bin126]|nr:MAG: serine/threonine protein kinase [Planctomycetes bacterium ADurb.Bin126]HOD80384.1 hypothetical protein [Phycisphaerae bacterium]HQL74386.1 hypothetical protein [Phycisphaerae bacterium]
MPPKISSANTQMFALRCPPPGRVELGGCAYDLVRVFKHDFFAATCLYQAAGPAAPFDRVVVKFGRDQAFCGLPLAWYGRLLRRHEEAIYRLLAGIEGVPRWAGSLSETAYAIEYIDARPLDHLEAPPPGLFDRLREIFCAIHARGVGYCDANKRSNILVDDAGQPFLIDYQIAIRRRDDLPWPLSSLSAAAVRYIQQRDVYHLFKHKRRLCPDQMTPQEMELSRKRTGLHWLHRKLTKPWRSLRRAFLSKQYRTGQLASPTAELEDHYQPEKDAWRK